MDPNGHLYRAKDVPLEDKARLDGYLFRKMEEQVEELKAKVSVEEQLEKVLTKKRERGPR